MIISRQEKNTIKYTSRSITSMLLSKAARRSVMLCTALTPEAFSAPVQSCWLTIMVGLNSQSSAS